MTDLSILIPARNELFLKNTVEDILAHIEADTEILVFLDGKWADPPIPQHPRVTLVYVADAIGQRAATNALARVARGKYVMKVDAHCSFGQGFDRILLEDMQDDITMVPKMYNLHAFDWVCACGHRRYQGPSAPCEKCGCEMTRDILWHAKPSPETTAMRFDKGLHFQYWSQYKKRQGDGHLVETMSILGACFMLTKERYFALDICDEAHGSWGQQGTEVACKTWLSGGRLMVNKRTWFAHMFRTQGGDFGFPYPQSGAQVDHARRYSRDMWLNNKWDKATHSLSWLIDKFAPVPDWDGTRKGIVYYTDNQLDPCIDRAVRSQLQRAAGTREIVSVSLQPLDFGKNIHLDMERGYLTMFRQILAGLEASTADIVFLCEHDVIYHPSHFDFTPPRKDTYYYNENIFKVSYATGSALFYYCRQTSGLCAYRELLIGHYRKRIDMVERSGFNRRMGFEPGTHNRAERVDDYKAEAWMSEYPNLDIRHNKNLTPSRWRKDQFRDQRYTRGWLESDVIPYWGKTKGRIQEILEAL
jgi:hypothetical protein